MVEESANERRSLKKKCDNIHTFSQHQNSKVVDLENDPKDQSVFGTSGINCIFPKHMDLQTLKNESVS